MDTVEFNLTVRGLNKFFRSNKSVGLVVIDGIHFIENQDILNQFEKKQVKQKVSAKNQNVVIEMAAGQDMPTGDDFFNIPTTAAATGIR